jgi:hypothetical protein
LTRSIHKISEAWKIPADLLVRPYKIERALEPRQWSGRGIAHSRQCVEQRLGRFRIGRLEILGKGFPVSPNRISLR